LLKITRHPLHRGWLGHDNGNGEGYLCAVTWSLASTMYFGNEK